MGTVDRGTPSFFHPCNYATWGEARAHLFAHKDFLTHKQLLWHHYHLEQQRTHLSDSIEPPTRSAVRTPTHTSLPMIAPHHVIGR